MELHQFYDLEDNMASSLTSEKITDKARKLTAGIQECLSKRPRDIKRAQILALQLRQLNRHSNYRLRKLKEAMTTVRTEAEQAFLAQNNLNSEIAHIKRNIVACLDYKSLHEDMDLVPLEEFKEKAPEVMEVTDEILNDDHKLTLARLDYEMLQRNTMMDQLQELEGRRNVLASDISGKEHRLKQVDPIVDRLRSTTKELFDLLGA